MIRLEDVFARRLEDVLKTSLKRLEDVLKMSGRHFSRRFEDVLKTFRRRLEGVLKTFWRSLQIILETSWQDVLKRSWRHLVKTYGQAEYFGLDQDVLKTFSEDVTLRWTYLSWSRRLEGVFIKTNVCWDICS